MIKTVKTIGIVSLSAGTIGEDFVKHEVAIGIRRLEEYGLNVRFLPHARKGIEYVKEHPEHRAADLISAFQDPEIDMILCAIGGDDPYLPIVCNINIGHALPRCIIPFGVDAEVDVKEQRITFR